jgi:L-cystine transport system permease protein
MINNLFSWERFFSEIPKILPALGTTFRIVLVSALFATVIGVIIALIQIQKIPVLHQISKVYVSFFRGTSLLVQLLLIYYGIPQIIDALLGTSINQTWGPIIFVYITFACNEGAFLSAIFYGAITSVPVGQLEAGYSVGLTKAQIYRRIIIPQAIRSALPPFGTDLIGLFQSTALVYYIGVVDLMGRAKAVGSKAGHYLEAYLIVAVVYVVLCAIMRLVFAYFNRHLDYGKNRKTRRLNAE